MVFETSEATALRSLAFGASVLVCLPRSSNGSGSRFFNPQTGVRFPGTAEGGRGYLMTFRAEVQMEARLFWEQEGLGSTPGCPTLMVVEGWLPKSG